MLLAMVRVGVVGLGGMGSLHSAKLAQMEGVELFGFDRHPERVQAFAHRTGGTGCPSFESLLEAVDVVDICLPTDLHLEHGLKAIAAGRAVLMEKPMALTVEDCATLIEAADQAGVPLMPAQVVRYFPEYRLAHDLIAEGKLGTLATLRLRRGGTAPKGSDDWFMDVERSGGVLLDLAIHDFDWMRWTAGEVRSVYARSARISGLTQSADYALATLQFDSGALGHVEATWKDPSGFRTTLEACGSDGMLEHDSRANAALRWSLADGTSTSEGSLAPTDDPYYREIRAFLDAVASGDPPPVSGYDGLMAVSIARASMESAWTERAVTPSRG